MPHQEADKVDRENVLSDSEGEPIIGVTDERDKEVESTMAEKEVKILSDSEPEGLMDKKDAHHSEPSQVLVEKERALDKSSEFGIENSLLGGSQQLKLSRAASDSENETESDKDTIKSNGKYCALLLLCFPV